MIAKAKEHIYTTFRAFQHRNYRLFFFGQGISLIGTWIQQIAMSWLIYSMTKSPLIMGFVTFAGTVPSLFLSPFAGVFIDRIDKYKFMIIIQALFMIEAFIFALLTLSGIIQIWQIILLGILIGLTAAIDMPLRQSFVIQLIGKSEDLGNAISLNSSCFNLARLLGPAIAGVLIAKVGEGTCFMINSLSYIAVIAGLLAMQIQPEKAPVARNTNVLYELKEGFIYAHRTQSIKNALLLLAASSFVGMSFPVLMPVYAKEILHGNAQTLGFLMSASGIGALIGALFLAWKKNTDGLERIASAATLFSAIGLVGLTFCSKFIPSLGLMFLTGLGMVIIMASCNTIIQHNVDHDKRGRVMSLYAMAFMGTAPIGSLVGGAIANKIGIADTLFLGGIAMLIIAIIFSFRAKNN